MLCPVGTIPPLPVPTEIPVEGFSCTAGAISRDHAPLLPHAAAPSLYPAGAGQPPVSASYIITKS